MTLRLSIYTLLKVHCGFNSIEQVLVLYLSYFHWLHFLVVLYIYLLYIIENRDHHRPEHDLCHSRLCPHFIVDEQAHHQSPPSSPPII